MVISFLTLKITIFNHCCGSASIIMRIWIRDPKNVHMDPDPDADLDPDPRG